MRRRGLEASLVGLCLTVSGIAPAQPAQPAAATGALAESLFRDGKALMAQGQYAEACPKLAESNRIDPGLGVLLALGFCHEKDGKPATAWAEFVTARGLAERAHDAEREQLAREYIQRLETKLVRVSVRVHPEMHRLPGFEVRHNGVALAQATWGTTAPVDLGEHLVEATAPGREPWVKRFVAREGDPPYAIEVPPLESRAAAGSPPPMVAPLESPPENHSRTWGFAVGGFGIASVAVGTVFGVRAIGLNKDAKALCAPESCTSAEGMDLNGQARTSATISTVVVGAGLVAIGVGAFLVLTARSNPPRTRESGLRLVPHAGPDGLGAGMRGAW